MIGSILNTLFGGGRNVVTETIGVFRPSSENQEVREATYDQAALAQYGAEFLQPKASWFERFVEGLKPVF